MSTDLPARAPGLADARASTDADASRPDRPQTERRADARAWVEVDPAALRRNFRTVRARVGPEVGVIPMVKADAYGLGAIHAVRALASERPAAWGVATVDEGIELRDAGVTEPIHLFAPVTYADLARALYGRLRPVLSDLAGVDAWVEAAKGRLGEAGFTIEIDTGMGRAGFPADRVAEWGPAVSARTAAPSLTWHGVFTHLHSADATRDGSVAAQLETFRTALQVLDAERTREGRGRLARHVANSAAALRYPEALKDMDAVRPGIFLYGGGVGDGAPEPEDVVAVRARVIRVSEVPPGTPLGYGATYRSSRAETWATLGIGYGDGLPRALSNAGTVLVHGRRLPIIGRISMDVTVVDSTELGILEVGQVVTVIGRSEGARISLDEVAKQAQTIHYEVLTGLTRRLPRVWMDRS